MTPRRTIPDEARALAVTHPGRAEHMFPALTSAQVARVAQHGRARKVAAGEVLLMSGKPPCRSAWSRPRTDRPPRGHRRHRHHRPRPRRVHGRSQHALGPPLAGAGTAVSDGEVIELDRDGLLSLVQTDAELSEIVMRAFILRRVELIASGLGDVVLVGSTHCAGTLRVREFLTRNGHPYTSIDLDRDDGVQALLDRFEVSAADVPVLICRGERGAPQSDATGRSPTASASTRRSTRPRSATWSSSAPAHRDWPRPCSGVGRARRARDRDECAGRAGRFELEDRELPGISDRDLGPGAGRPRVYAGAEVRRADRHRERRTGARVRAGGRTRCRSTTTSACPARAVVIATGAAIAGSRSRTRAVRRRRRLLRRHRHGGAAVPRRGGRVVGGGNSAGQAAVFLAQHGERLHARARPGLAETMSRYLIRRIEDNPEDRAADRDRDRGARWRG